MQNLDEPKWARGEVEEVKNQQLQHITKEVDGRKEREKERARRKQMIKDNEGC